MNLGQIKIVIHDELKSYDNKRFARTKWLTGTIFSALAIFAIFAVPAINDSNEMERSIIELKLTAISSTTLSLRSEYEALSDAIHETKESVINGNLRLARVTSDKKKVRILSIDVRDNKESINSIKKTMATKNDIQAIMKKLDKMDK